MDLEDRRRSEIGTIEFSSSFQNLWGSFEPKLLLTLASLARAEHQYRGGSATDNQSNFMRLVYLKLLVYNFVGRYLLSAATRRIDELIL